MHRELNLSNVYIDNEGVIKIGGFHHATYFNKNLKDKFGTLVYQAPEILF